MPQHLKKADSMETPWGLAEPPWAPPPPWGVIGGPLETPSAPPHRTVLGISQGTEARSACANKTGHSIINYCSHAVLHAGGVGSFQVGPGVPWGGFQ